MLVYVCVLGGDESPIMIKFTSFFFWEETLKINVITKYSNISSQKPRNNKLYKCQKARYKERAQRPITSTVSEPQLLSAPSGIKAAEMSLLYLMHVSVRGDMSACRDSRNQGRVI